jgi:hypothetical protein
MLYILFYVQKPKGKKLHTNHLFVNLLCMWLAYKNIVVRRKCGNQLFPCAVDGQGAMYKVLQIGNEPITCL